MFFVKNYDSSIVEEINEEFKSCAYIGMCTKTSEIKTSSFCMNFTVDGNLALQEKYVAELQKELSGLFESVVTPSKNKISDESEKRENESVERKPKPIQLKVELNTLKPNKPYYPPSGLFTRGSTECNAITSYIITMKIDYFVSKSLSPVWDLIQKLCPTNLHLDLGEVTFYGENKVEKKLFEKFDVDDIEKNFKVMFPDSKPKVKKVRFYKNYDNTRERQDTEEYQRSIVLQSIMVIGYDFPDVNE